MVRIYISKIHFLQKHGFYFTYCCKRSFLHTYMKSIFSIHRKVFYNKPIKTTALRKNKAAVLKQIVFNKKSISFISLSGINKFKRRKAAPSFVFNATLIRSTLLFQADYNYPGLVLI